MTTRDGKIYNSYFIKTLCIYTDFQYIDSLSGTGNMKPSVM